MFPTQFVTLEASLAYCFQPQITLKKARHKFHELAPIVDTINNSTNPNCTS